MSAGQKISRDQPRRYARAHVIGVKEISGNLNCPLDPSPCLSRERVRAVEMVIETHPHRIPHLRARNLRHDQTDAEAKLWARLRGGQLEGLKFRRQFPLGQFIADFCCPQRRLIIELDGGQHAEQRSADEWRSRILSERGYRVQRFWNDEVLTNMDGVLEQILGVLREGE